MRYSLSELLEQGSKMEPDARREHLRRNDSHALRQVFWYALNRNVEWLLPKGKPPYKVSNHPDLFGVLFSNMRKLYLFVKGGNDNLKQIRREALFIEMLESVHPKDAELLLSMKDGKIPYPGYSANFIRNTFPGLLPEKTATEPVEEDAATQK